MGPGKGVDPALLLAWAAARSVSRGLPAPVVDGAAVRVDTGLSAETRRYIFPTVTPAIAALAATIAEPRILIKLCAPLPILMAILPPGWRAHPQSFLMACDGPMRSDAASLPRGYTLGVGHKHGVLIARIDAPDGTLAARGRAVHHAGLFVYDQIATEAAHRRRGLGSAVMRALATHRSAARQLLTATAAGHSLYVSLGWTVVSLYSTAEFGEAREP